MYGEIFSKTRVAILSFEFMYGIRTLWPLKLYSDFLGICMCAYFWAWVHMCVYISGNGSVLFIRFSKWSVNTPKLVNQLCPKPFGILDHEDGSLCCSDLFTAPPCWPFPSGGLGSLYTDAGIGHVTSFSQWNASGSGTCRSENHWVVPLLLS